jgi:hypothetical protein
LLFEKRCDPLLNELHDRHDRETILNDTKLLELFRQSPAAQKLLAEEKTAIEKTRRGNAAMLKKIDADATVRAIEIDKEIKNAIAAVTAAEEALSKARKTLRDLESQQFHEDAVMNYRRDALVRLIYATSFKCVEEWNTELERELEELRSREVKDTRKGSVIMSVWPSVTRRTEAIIDLLQKVDDLRLIPSEEDAIKKIAELRDGLPPIVAESIAAALRW